MAAWFVCCGCGAMMSVRAFECDECKQHWIDAERARITERNVRNARIFRGAKRFATGKGGE